MHPAQNVRFCTSRDGTRIAFAECGMGPPLVWVQHWVHHLSFDWGSPIWRHWLGFLAQRFRVIRWDWRGCGLSDRDHLDLSFPRLVEDMEAVVTAAGLDRFDLFGMAGAGSGAAIHLATRQPHRLGRLVLYAPHVMGRLAGEPGAEARSEAEARLKMVELGWANRHDAYTQFFARLHAPNASDNAIKALSDLLHTATSGANAIGLLRSFWGLDLGDLPASVDCPTLVLHARGDSVIPFEEGRRVALLIRGARFVPIESSNHLLLEPDEGWQQLKAAVMAFLPGGLSGDPAGFAELTPRERQVLEFVAQGQGNKVIAATLGISEKTARNHVSAILSKLRVGGRARAIVLARESGFGHGLSR